MPLNMKSFIWDNDFNQIHDFITEIFLLSPSARYWNPNRFENRKFGPCGIEYTNKDDERVKIWEIISDDRASKKIVAISIEENESYYWILTHPKYKKYEIEIIQYIEKQSYASKKKKNISHVEIFINSLEDDKDRVKLLLELGYKNLGRDSYNRIRPIDMPVQQYYLPRGFSIRHVDIENDFEQYRSVIGSVFGHCKNMSFKQAQHYTTASFYHSELDIVAVDELDNFAAFCTFRFDPKSKIVELEPVGTHPKYRKMGLGKAIILEGLKRLEKLKPSYIFLNNAADTEGANALYDSLGFTIKQECLLWRKII
ncbi:MAG: GNAT family N-acetyltransferase [Candidatus Thorarchaeota archaeon]